MNINFKIGLPETAGLVIVGSTIGALLGGAGSGEFGATAALGAVIGAAVPALAAIVPRLGRRTEV